MYANQINPFNVNEPEIVEEPDQQNGFYVSSSVRIVNPTNQFTKTQNFSSNIPKKNNFDQKRKS